MFATTMQSLSSSPWVVRGVGSALLVWLAWTAGYGVSLWMQPLNNPELPKLVMDTHSSSPQIQTGQAAYLMGKPVVSTNQPVQQNEVQAEQVSKTRLRLELLGVIDLPQKGVALIRTSGKTKAVAEGEEIQKGVELLEVHSDLVILSHRGKREKLMMQPLDQSLFTVSSNKTSNNSRLQAVDAQALKEVRQSIQDNPLSISKFVRFKPVGRSGAWHSIRVWPRTNRDLFKSLGFKSGDSIISVNGVSVADLSKQPAAWQSLLSETQFEMVVKRHGKEMPLSIQLD